MIGVAILDQDPMIRSLLETHVKKVEGYEIIGSMESIEELKQHYRQGKVQLLIGETRGIDGALVDWIAKLREENHPLDFIVITKDTSYGTFYDMRRYGVIDYILKPFTYVRFRGALMQYRICKEQITPENEMTQKQLDLFFFPDALVGRYGGSHTFIGAGWSQDLYLWSVHTIPLFPVKRENASHFMRHPSFLHLF